MAPWRLLNLEEIGANQLQADGVRHVDDTTTVQCCTGFIRSLWIEATRRIVLAIAGPTLGICVATMTQFLGDS